MAAMLGGDGLVGSLRSRFRPSTEQEDLSYGPSPSLEELQRLRRVAAALTAGRVDSVASLFPGAYRALFHGRGLEFDEVRAYQWGDDYRTLDWRVTARTGALHTKLFHEEREHSLILVLDAGATMRFGSRARFKWTQAARLAAVFAWLAVEAGDRVGVLIHGDGARCHGLSPQFGQGGVLRLFRLLAGIRDPAPGTTSTLDEALHLLRRTARPGTLILLVGDFLSLEGAAQRHLAHLARHNDLAAVLVFDPLEADLPPPGLYPVSDGARRMVLDTTDTRLRQAYRETFEARRDELMRTFRARGIGFFSMATDASLQDRLRSELHAAVTSTARRQSIDSRHAGPSGR